MYLNAMLKCILMYLTGHIKIHAEYMHDTCKIHRIRILITNVPKFDNKCTVTWGGFWGRESGNSTEVLEALERTRWDQSGRASAASPPVVQIAFPSA